MVPGTGEHTSTSAAKRASMINLHTLLGAEKLKVATREAGILPTELLLLNQPPKYRTNSNLRATAKSTSLRIPDSSTDNRLPLSINKVRRQNMGCESQKRTPKLGRCRVWLRAYGDSRVVGYFSPLPILEGPSSDRSIPRTSQGTDGRWTQPISQRVHNTFTFTERVHHC